MSSRYSKYRHFSLGLLVVLSVSFFNVNCKENQFAEDGETTNASLLVDAKLLINDQDWAGAIAKFNEMDASFRDLRENAIYYASAHAGACGLSLQPVLDAAENMGSQTPMQFMLETMQGASQTELDSCLEAERIIEENTSSDATLRNESENLIHTLVMIGKIGAILSVVADPNGDGTPDLNHNDTCSAVSVPETHVRNLGTGLTKMVLSIGQMSNSAVSGIDSDLTTVCDNINTYDPDYNFCNITDPAGFNSDQIKGIRSLIQEGVVFGISTCVPPVPPLPAGTQPELQYCPCL